MRVVETSMPGVFIVEPQYLDDNRGVFAELYHADRYAKQGIGATFVQDNFSRSARNVLRGLHVQNPRCQGKLVTVLRGAVVDVAVDIRVGSPSFGKYIKMELNEQNRRQLWIPRGFAHGFFVISESADVLYKCDDFYRPNDELVIKWNDPVLAISWGATSPELSQRDRDGRSLTDLKSFLPRFENIG